MAGAALLVAPLAGGCAPNDSGPSLGNLTRNFGDDWAGARSIDRATVDLSRGNIEAIQQAGRALDKRIRGGSRASIQTVQSWMDARVADAGVSDTEAAYSDSGFVRDEARRDADTQYRAALAFLPSDPKNWSSLDPQTLNAVGYFLAARGRNQAEFEKAEKLTALALEQAPKQTAIERYFRAQGAGDSHAWALFRLGRTKDALQAQAAVISALGEESGSNPYFSSVEAKAARSEVIYHWGAICRVAGQETAARDAFKAALTQNPSPELREILEINLEGDLV